jgi:hypothetical protein
LMGAVIHTPLSLGSSPKFSHDWMLLRGYSHTRASKQL